MLIYFSFQSLTAEVKSDQITTDDSLTLPFQVKQERLEIEKPNDISVYDFDEGEIVTLLINELLNLIDPFIIFSFL